jgi:signal transduction histidine kinase
VVRIGQIAAVLVVALGTALAGAGAMGNEDAWLRHGSYVTQVYSIPQGSFAATLTFVSQLPDGSLIVGASSGAYLYDGSRWTQIVHISKACSLLWTRNGKILVGGGGTVFELRRGGVGEFEATARLVLGGVEDELYFLAEDQKGNLLGAYGKGLFQAGEGTKAKLTGIGSEAQGIASIPSGTFVSLNDHGFHLTRIDESLVPTNIEGGFRSQLGDEHVVDIKPRDSGSCWAITSGGRTFSFDGQLLHPAPWLVANPGLRITPSCIVGLNGGFMVGTLQDGLFIFGRDGSMDTHLNSENGLPEDAVVAAATDRDGGLWVATQRKLVRLDARLRFLDFGTKQGLNVQDGEVTTRYRGKLYVAGSGGLFVQNPAAREQKEAFQQVPGPTAVRGLVSDGETLWFGGHTLSSIGSDGRLRAYDTKEVYSLLSPGDRRDLLLCGTSDGFALLQKSEGQWRVETLVPAGGLTVYGIGELSPNEYWAMLGTGKAARLRESQGTWGLKVFGAESGLPDRWIDLGITEGHILVPGEPWHPLPGTLADEWDEARGRFVPTGDYTYYYGWLGPHVYHPVFYKRNGEALVMATNRDCRLVDRPPKIIFSAIQEAAQSRESCAYGVYEDQDGAIWINHLGGVLRYAGSFEEPQPREDSLVVRQIQDIRSGRLLAANVRNGGSLSLDPENNWLRISAALLEYRSEEFAIFRIWLEGFEPEPSGDSWLNRDQPNPGNQHWSTVSERDLSNLPSGRYTLHVEALDGMGIRKQELLVALEIRTPWYRSRMAVASYAAAGVLLVGLLIWTREMRLRWRNRQLARAVEQGRAEIRSKHEELQKVLLRTEELARDLAGANTALNRSAEAKTEFVRRVSHELRNPIAGARMMADILSRSKLGEPALRQVTNLRSCVYYLQTLLDETLDITQVESGQVAVKLEQFTAAGLISEVASIFENIAREKGLAFDVDPGPAADLVLCGDKTHSKRILINYLSNALKFTVRGGVTLRARVVSRAEGLCRLRFEVADTGPGISDELKGRLFSKFVRESSRSENDSTPGAGLGLALCKELAEFSGGSVGFETRRGEGSTFWVELPYITALGPLQPDGAAPDAGPDFSDLGVCVVDDDPVQLEAMASMLGEFGVVPETARTSAEAVERLAAGTFNVVLVDYHLGLDSGMLLPSRLAALDLPVDGVRPCFHMVTALWDEGLARKASESGFQGCHRKPVSMVALFQILRSGRQARR